MWRAILLGKMSVFILASVVVSGICFTHPSRLELTMAQSVRWTGLGIFFLTLGLAQIAVIYFLMKRKK